MSDGSASLNNRNLQMCLEQISELSRRLSNQTDGSSDSEKYQKMQETYKRISAYKHSVLDLQLLEKDEYIKVFKELLVSNNPQILNQTGKFLHFFLHMDPSLTRLFRVHQIHIILARILEAALANSSGLNDIVGYFKLLKEWIERSPENFPLICFHSLRMAAENTSASAKKIRKLALEIVQLISMFNIDLFMACNGFGVLLKAMVTKEIEDVKLSSSITDTFLQNLMDDEALRNALLNSCALDTVFRTYFQYQALPLDPKAKIPNEKEHFDSMEQAILANDFVKKMLAAPVGLFFFMESPSFLQTTFELLRQRCIKNDIKRLILRLVDDVIALPPASPDATCFCTLRLQLLLSCDLYAILFEVSQQEEFEDRAKEVLQALTKSCSVYLPVKDRPNANSLCHLFVCKATGVDSDASVNAGTCADHYISSGGIIVSKISSILDNNFTENFYGGSLSSEQRRNPFLFSMEELYCNTKNAFRDTRTARKYPWTGLSTKQAFGALELNALLDNLPEKWTLWDLDMVDQLLDDFQQDKSRLNDKLQRPFFSRFLGLFLNEELINLPWNAENFRLLKVVYKFLELLLSHDDEAASVLKTNVAENPFKPYESFMKKIKSLFGPGRNILKGAMIKLPKNCTFQQNTDDQPDSIDLPSRLSYVITENSFMQGNKILRQKTVEFEEFDVFQVTLLREYVALVAFMTFFPRGVTFLAEYKVFEALKGFCKKSAKYWKMLAVFMLTANYQCSEVQFLMLELLVNNSEYLQRLTVGILHFLALAEHYEIVLKFVDNLLSLLKDYSPTLQMLIFDLLRRVVLETNHDVLVLRRMPVSAILSSNDFLDAVLRKEEAVKYLAEKGILHKIYENFLNSGGPSRLYENFRSASPKDSFYAETQFADMQDYCYPHYPQHCKQFLSESGVFLAAVMRFPWGIRLTQHHNQSRVKTMVYCQTTYNPLLECVDVVAKITGEIGLQFGEMGERAKDWRLVACVFISNSLVNESLEMVSDDNFFREAKVSADQVVLSDNEIVARNNGVEFVFRRSQALDQTLILRQVCLRVFMRPKRRREAEHKHLSFYELICQTQSGAEFLDKKNAIDETIERIVGRIVGDDQVEDQRCSLYCLGLIGKTHFGSLRLQQRSERMERILTLVYSEATFLSLRADIHLMANMIAQSEGGQRLLEQSKWQIEFLAKKVLPVVRVQMVATNPHRLVRKPSQISKSSFLYHNLIVSVTTPIFEKDQKSPVRILVGVLQSGSKTRPKKLYETIDEAVDLFVFCAVYLSTPSDFTSSTRQFLWGLLDELIKTHEVSAALDSPRQANTAKFMENV